MGSESQSWWRQVPRRLVPMCKFIDLDYTHAPRPALRADPRYMSLRRSIGILLLHQELINLNEFKLLKNLDHPNIIKMREVYLNELK